jgi:2-keto-3-deoxy-L-rhamnonate aldolase RhmA
VGIARAHGYGLFFQEYIDTANQNVAVILQIEDVEAVNNIEAIVRVKGFDALLVGPYDLSGSMGKIGSVSDPDVQKQIEKVRSVCTEAGLPLGVFGMGVRAVKPYIDKGFTLIGMGVDTTYLIDAAREAIQNIRE